MDLRIILLASVLAISASNAQDCCILEVWENCVIPCPLLEGNALISQKVKRIGQKMKLLSKADSFPALRKTGAFKRLMAMRSFSGLTVDQTCDTCKDMIRDFKTLLTSPEGVQYWDEYLDTICYIMGMIDYDLEQTCISMIDSESSLFINMIVEEIDEVEICSMFLPGC